MNVFDLVILFLLIIFVLRGAMKGMVSQIVSVGSYFVCWIIASRFAFIIAPSIPAVAPWNQVGAIAVLFVIAMIGIRFLHSAAEKWIKNRTLARRTNMLLGGGLGFVKALLICMVITFFGVMIAEATREIIFNSKSGLLISKLIVKTGAFIPKGSCSLLEEQLARFTVEVDGTPLDPSNETASIAAMLQNGLDDLWQTISNHEQNNPSEESNSALKSVFADVLNRGNELLEKSKLAEETKKPPLATSLLDGVIRWWNGEKSPATETDSGSEKTASQAIAQKEEIQNDVNALLQEGKKTVHEKINRQVSAAAAAIKPVVSDNTKQVDLLPSTAKTVLQNSGEPLAVDNNSDNNNVTKTVPENIAANNLANNSVPDTPVLPFLHVLQDNPAQGSTTVPVASLTVLPPRRESFLLRNERQGRLKTSDILNSASAASGSRPAKAAVLFQP
ncbi:MAG: CvpA family protein [Planctomycetaceae bacterium]|nr:CvpA family protein [Planctomycetaceae bacterium]